MKTIVADIMAKPYDSGGLPWGLWHDICLYLQAAGSSERIAVNVREIDYNGFHHETDPHTVTFGLEEQDLDLEWINIGQTVEVWFGAWPNVDSEWQTESPVADGVITYIL